MTTKDDDDVPSIGPGSLWLVFELCCKLHPHPRFTMFFETFCEKYQMQNPAKTLKGLLSYQISSYHSDFKRPVTIILPPTLDILIAFIIQFALIKSRINFCESWLCDYISLTLKSNSVPLLVTGKALIQQRLLFYCQPHIELYDVSAYSINTGLSQPPTGSAVQSNRF